MRPREIELYCYELIIALFYVNIQRELIIALFLRVLTTSCYELNLVAAPLSCHTFCCVDSSRGLYFCVYSTRELYFNVYSTHKL